ncbi:uncharacterized protein BYT42DRAFT_580796 [Radiomyces spectabilis]|uniref:uncharacterized protein n=1 Tax=Radiomyces spectabilis TaxID=64574 RepID=UPI00222097A2|nr:uncharacterized protein BYT42DRAFT_580796 [Radiomyces spectabilis]KAI8371590.1 hypothetical protein BYT42DRAFT_580796 [Radiomyces spectabilis]
MNKPFFNLKKDPAKNISKSNNNPTSENLSKFKGIKSGLTLFRKLRSTLRVFTHHHEPHHRTLWQWCHHHKNGDTPRRSVLPQTLSRFRSLDDINISTHSKPSDQTNFYPEDEPYRRLRASRSQTKSIKLRRSLSREQLHHAYTIPHNGYGRKADQPLTSILIKPYGSSTHTVHPASSCSTSSASAGPASERISIGSLSSRKPSDHKRQNSHLSSYVLASNITTHSEDLTAKEFADIAGIKILPEDEFDDDAVMYTASSFLPFPYHHREETVNMSLYTQSSMYSHGDTLRRLQIWDPEFWINPDSGQSASSVGTSSQGHIRAADHVTKHHDSGLELLPVSHDLRRVKTVPDEDPYHRLGLQRASTTMARNHVIKKGRFEIHLETTNSIPDIHHRCAYTETLVDRKRSHTVYPSAPLAAVLPSSASEA